MMILGDYCKIEDCRDPAVCHAMPINSLFDRSQCSTDSYLGIYDSDSTRPVTSMALFIIVKSSGGSSITKIRSINQWSIEPIGVIGVGVRWNPRALHDWSFESSVLAV